MLSMMMRHLMSENPTNIDLFKVSKVLWAVRTPGNPETQNFTNIEAAGVYLESIGIPGDEVDFALMDMTVKAHTRANFGVEKGTFLFSDGLRLDELLGSA
jgi:hypothetical protein